MLFGLGGPIISSGAPKVVTELRHDFRIAGLGVGRHSTTYDFFNQAVQHQAALRFEAACDGWYDAGLPERRKGGSERVKAARGIHNCAIYTIMDATKAALLTISRQSIVCNVCFPL